MSTTIEHFFTAPAQHPCYEHHFPGEPIVPAALLMNWVIEQVESLCEGITVAEVKSMKFLAVLRPGDECRLNLTRVVEKKSIKLDVSGPEGLLCKGVFSINE